MNLMLQANDSDASNHLTDEELVADTYIFMLAGKFPLFILFFISFMKIFLFDPSFHFVKSEASPVFHTSMLSLVLKLPFPVLSPFLPLS